MSISKTLILIKKCLAAKNHDALILLISREKRKLGGQDKRWCRVASEITTKGTFNTFSAINESTFHLLVDSEVVFNHNSLLVIPDFSNRIIDAIAKNLAAFILCRKANIIHVPDQAIFLYLGVFASKLFFRKKIVFSFTGNRLEGLLSSGSNTSFYKRIRFFSKVSDAVEVLNPIVAKEPWPQSCNLIVAPCSFSDPSVFTSGAKDGTVVWAGHFYAEKGIRLLKHTLLANRKTKYKFLICGSHINTPESIEFSNWINNFSQENGWLQVQQATKMDAVYRNASIVLSTQDYSNYPSQVVLEGLLSGCQIIMTDSGDSRLFELEGVVHFIDPAASGKDVIDLIGNVYGDDCQDAALKARNFVLQNHTVERYSKHINDVWSRILKTN